MQITAQNYKQLTAAQINNLTQQQMQQYNAIVNSVNKAKQAAKRPPYYKQQQKTLKQLAESVMRLQHDLRISAQTKNVYVENMFNSYLQHAHTDAQLLENINSNSNLLKNCPF